jgi:Ni,Fe-hydrogenase I large subunit
MSRIVVGPFNRVEGDLEVTLDIADNKVRAAWVNSSLFRGFEQILQGKDPNDAMVFVPRICGICSVSQSYAAASTLANAMGLVAPPNGQYAASLILATENLADHFTHFYLFFMPDFARDAYRDRPWFGQVQARFKAVSGSAAGDALPVRTAFLELMGFLAGKWPHTLTLQPGGSSRAIQASEMIRIHSLLRQFRSYLEKTLFGDTLESVAALDSCAALEAWIDKRAPGASDFRLFLEIARDLALDEYGRGPGCYLSYGSYALPQGKLFGPGVWDGATLHTVDEAAISEDISHAWLDGSATARHPAEGETRPYLDKDGAYTWCKAPRWNGRVVEVGALARQVADGHPLIRELVGRKGGNVAHRVIARMLEIARVVPQMEAWVRAIVPGERFCEQGEIPEDGYGVGLVEAARGALGHWLVIRRGVIHNYQIIAPTTWNFSPRDGAGRPGALEQALTGLAVPVGGRAPVAVQHVVRSFDPCMVCTVH